MKESEVKCANTAIHQDLYKTYKCVNQDGPTVSQSVSPGLF